MNYEDMQPMQKAAVALVAFGPEVSALVLKGMSEQDLERITVEIANLRDVPAEIEEKVISECHQIFMARHYISQGGVDFARSILEKAVGTGKAKEIMHRLESTIKSSGFSLLKDIDPKQLTGFLQNEHPQTIALILTQLTSQHAAAVLAELSPELQGEVSFRIATMEKIAPDILREIEQTLEGHFEQSAGGEMSTSGGAKALAEILNLIDTSAEKNVLQSMEAGDPDLAAEIKNMMFVFDDIVLLDDRSVQRLLKEVETKDLSLALKAASDEVKAKIFSNVSERVSVMIKEEMEFMGPTRLSDVEAAQTRIVEAIRRLEEEGQIIISGRGGKEDVIV
ncbi:MAG: flagellar motor switch protein FliG [candidate division Zixibacteria bacterium]|nr:flagellar motor switch protein FliG [candidate division Zixibacteria bacterium]MDH3937978.1 flagellar motor switch protein FliG [candidate division Zixibacteria bacterium]MDH4033164.1 flagellar motor switch protein FliG [candidate division Zixibacteria bacterium]